MQISKQQDELVHIANPLRIDGRGQYRPRHVSSQSPADLLDNLLAGLIGLNRCENTKALTELVKTDAFSAPAWMLTLPSWICPELAI
jgi:hypothetical protein